MDWNTQNNTRTVIGYLDTTISNHTDDEGRPVNGLARILFEECNKQIYAIGDKNGGGYFDEREEVFFTGAFGKLQNRYGHRLLKIKCQENRQKDEGQTNYVSFENQVDKLAKHDIYSFVNAELPNSIDAQITLSILPRTPILFIIDKGFAHGPFSLYQDDSDKNQDYVTGRLVSATTKEDGFDWIKVATILRFDFKQFLDANIDAFLSTEGEFYLTDTKLIKTKSNNIMPYMTVAQLAGLLSSMQENKNKAIKKKEVHLYIKQILASRRLPKNIEIGTIKPVLEQAVSLEDVQKNILNLITKDHNFSGFIDHAVSKEKEKYIGQWEKDAAKRSKKLASELEGVDTQIKSLSQNKSTLQRELSQLEDQIEEKTEKLNSEEFDIEIAKKRADLDESIKDLTEKVSIYQKQYQTYKSIEDLDEAVKEKRGDLKTAEKWLAETEESLKKINSQIMESEVALQTKLREMIPFVSSIISTPLPVKSETYPLSTQIITVLDEDKTDILILAAEFIRAITHKFNNDGRNYSQAFIASVIVAHHNSFISVFSGPPGIGKSSWGRHYKEYIEQGDRFLEIVVGRNWTTERELLGFFNSLTNSYNPAPSGFYEFLRGISQDDSEENSAHTVMLDESNLSPIEHYGAILLNIADSESDRNFLAGNEQINIPDTLNIIATVNHDMTTEPLSPRLLDRASVIPFDSKATELGDDDNAIESETDFKTNISAAASYRLFGTNAVYKDESLAEEMPTVIDALIDKMTEKSPDLGMPFHISQRKRKIVQNYISILTGLLKCIDGSRYENALTKACDFAALYYLLPVIHGSGKGCRQRLESLMYQAENEDLIFTKDKLEDMIEHGKHRLDTYNYFSY